MRMKRRNDAWPILKLRRPNGPKSKPKWINAELVNNKSIIITSMRPKYVLYQTSSKIL